MKDYSFLKGCEVAYISPSREKAKMFVANIDREIGITCKGNFEDEPEDAPLMDIICLNKDDYDQGYYNSHWNGSWDELFDNIAERLKTGIFTSPVKYTPSSNFSTCAFE